MALIIGLGPKIVDLSFRFVSFLSYPPFAQLTAALMLGSIRLDMLAGLLDMWAYPGIDAPLQ